MNRLTTASTYSDGSLALPQLIRQAIRNVPDYPSKGINFKDITPLLGDPGLSDALLEYMLGQLDQHQFTAVAAIESRGFLFGSLIAHSLSLPFIPIRKMGKLPFKTIKEEYSLEYGNATLEVHVDACKEHDRVLLHDDLLATGGTTQAACRLIERLGASVEACSFILSLSFLNGRMGLAKHCSSIYSVTEFTS